MGVRCRATIVAASLFPSLAFAAAGRWTSTGPSTPEVTSLAIDSSSDRTVYAIANNLLFRSVDGGLAWRSINPTNGSDDDAVYCLAADPFRSGTLYAGRFFGLVRSDDGGSTWNDLLGAVPQSDNAYVQAIAMAPSREGRFYFHTGDALYRTDDHGDHGTVLPGPWSADNALSAIAVDPSNADTVYVGVHNLGVLRSRDAGAHWGVVGVGLPDAPTELLVNPREPLTVYGLTPSGDLYEIVGMGSVWFPAGPPGKSVLAVAANSTDPERLLVGSDGVYESLDRGMSWTRSEPNSNPVNQPDFVESIAATGTVYAGTAGNAIFRFDGGGSSWIHCETGLKRIQTAALDASSPEVTFASGGYRPSRKRGRGVWETRGPCGVGAIAVHPAGETVYASAAGCTSLRIPTPYDPALYRSTDGGDSWMRVNDVYAQALAVDPTDEETVYAAVVTSVSFGNAFGTILRTRDGGGNWEDVGETIPAFAMTRLQVDPSRPERVFASDPIALYRSDDGGATWSNRSSSPIPGGVGDFAVSSAGDSMVYVADYLGVFRSADGGATWTQTSFNEGAASVTVDPTDSRIVYACTSSEVFRSVDSGDSWMPIGLGLSGSLSILRVDPTGTVLYAGTSDGVFEFDRRLTQVLPPR